MQSAFADPIQLRSSGLTLLVGACTLLGSSMHPVNTVLTDNASMLLETGIFASQAIWLWRVRHVRREAKKAGKTYDEYIAENPSKKIPRPESSETVVDVEACHSPKSQNTVSEKANAESREKRDTASGAKITTTETLTSTHGFMQKWRKLVLRPVSDSHS